LDEVLRALSRARSLVGEGDHDSSRYPAAFPRARDRVHELAQDVRAASSCAVFLAEQLEMEHRDARRRSGLRRRAPYVVREAYHLHACAGDLGAFAGRASSLAFTLGFERDSDLVDSLDRARELNRNFITMLPRPAEGMPIPTRRSSRASRWASWLAAFAVRMVPVTHRPRYWEEVAAELYHQADLPRWRQIVYASRLLSRTWALRRAVSGDAWFPARER
jgi:hypothetical protein